LAKIDGHAMNRLEEEQLIRQYWERVKKRGEQR